MNRDAILDALLKRFVDEVPGLRTYTRRDRGFEVMHFPALVLTTDTMDRDELGKWTIDGTVKVLVHVPNTDQSPETALNAVIDQVSDALLPHVDEPRGSEVSTTLGGLCDSCMVAGKIEMDQSEGLGAVAIPVQIIAYEAE